MLHVTAFEAVLVMTNGIGLFVNGAMLRDVIIDRGPAVRASRGRGLVASNAIRREALRVVGQLGILVLLVRWLYWDNRPGDVPGDYVVMLAVVVVIVSVSFTANGLLDRRNRHLIVAKRRWYD